VLRQAQVITEISLGANNPRLVRIIAQQAALFSIQQNYSQAETLYARALAALEASVPEHHPNIYHLRCKLAWCYYKQFKLDQAEQYRRKALEGKDKFFGNEYPNFAKTLQELAEICSKLAKYDQVNNNLFMSNYKRQKLTTPKLWLSEKSLLERTVLQRLQNR
jgi:tetratricopeptide (TPR) repeat protein